jgi:hypothetical protein
VEPIVKGMKLTPLQMQKIVEKIFDAWKKSNNVVVFKEDYSEKGTKQVCNELDAWM